VASVESTKVFPGEINTHNDMNVLLEHIAIWLLLHVRIKHSEDTGLMKIVIEAVQSHSSKANFRLSCIPCDAQHCSDNWFKATKLSLPRTSLMFRGISFDVCISRYSLGSCLSYAEVYGVPTPELSLTLSLILMLHSVQRNICLLSKISQPSGNAY
jgi:hypothetical protein